MKPLDQYITCCHQCPLKEFSNHLNKFFCSIVDKEIPNIYEVAPVWCPLLDKAYVIHASKKLKSYHNKLEVITITVSLDPEPPKPIEEDDDVLI